MNIYTPTETDDNVTVGSTCTSGAILVVCNVAVGVE